MKTKDITMIGLMAAVICVLGPLSITIPGTPVPISFTNLALYFIVMAAGKKRAALSYLIYMLLGAVGLPVFSAFTGGAAKLSGPTGGYLIGFLFLALISGWFVDRSNGNLWISVVGMVLGTAVTYAFGTAWLCIQMNLKFGQGLWIGVIPYLPGDAVKIVIAVIAGAKARNALKKSVDIF